MRESGEGDGPGTAIRLVCAPYIFFDRTSSIFQSLEFSKRGRVRARGVSALTPERLPLFFRGDGPRSLLECRVCYAQTR